MTPISQNLIHFTNAVGDRKVIIPATIATVCFLANAYFREEDLCTKLGLGGRSSTHDVDFNLHFYWTKVGCEILKEQAFSILGFVKWSTALASAYNLSKSIISYNAGQTPELQVIHPHQN